jgi:hypothetical protein
MPVAPISASSAGTPLGFSAGNGTDRMLMMDPQTAAFLAAKKAHTPYERIPRCSI